SSSMVAFLLFACSGPPPERSAAPDVPESTLVPRASSSESNVESAPPAPEPLPPCGPTVPLIRPGNMLCCRPTEQYCIDALFACGEPEFSYAACIRMFQSCWAQAQGGHPSWVCCSSVS